MADRRIPDVSSVASPPRQNFAKTDLQLDDAPIGAGGQAVVYEARTATNAPPTRVALKQPSSPQAQTRDTVDRDTSNAFLKQATTWATVDRRERQKPRWQDSEHIVGVIDTGETLPWIAMEYMDGGDLTTRLARSSGGLPVEEALWIGECICRGLEVAHNYGIAHLDLKPANVLFRETGPDTWDVPKIADWGLSRVLSEQTGAMEGLSVEYAAPEQFEPTEFGDPDMLTDVYQAGAVVYTLLTGESPYTGRQTSIMFDVVSDEAPAPPSTVRETISDALDVTVLTALQTAKQDRYQNIKSFEQALQAVRTDAPLPPIIQRRVTDASESTPTATPPRNSGQSHAAGTWSMFGGGPRRTGHHPTATGPQQATTQWCFETGYSMKSSPAVVDGTVYSGSCDSSVYAVDVATGEKHWQFDTGDAVRSSPTVVDGTIYIGSTDDNLYAVDTTTGEKHWQFETGGWVVSSPAVVDGTVYVGSDDLYGVDATTGEKIWEYEFLASQKSSPAVAGGTVYVGNQKGTVHAVDTVSGEKNWQFETNSAVRSSPAVADGTVYVGSCDDNVYAVDAISGEKHWEFDTGYSVESSPAVVDGTVYVGSDDTNLYAVDAATGEKHWQFETGGRVRSSPAVVDGTVYVGSDDGNVYAVDAASGEKQWQFDTGYSPVESSPAVVDRTVYIGSRDGNMYAVGESD